MALVNNLDKVSYNTFYSTDKIVQTYTGSFRYGDDTITRNYTLAGFPNNQQVYRIAHGYTRPLFVEMFWSTDDISYYVGTGADNGLAYGIAYSDSTYIYIMPSALAAGTRFYYKLTCSWMDEWDTTNPTVEAFDNLPPTYTQTFNSRSIIPSIVQQGVVQASTTSAFMTNVEVQTAHNLGYAPEMKVYFEAFSNEVWPLNSGGAANPYLVDDSQLELAAFTGIAQLATVFTIKQSNGTRRAWYSLYGDRGGLITGNYSRAQNVI